jgi:hypothetical protein
MPRPKYLNHEDTVRDKSIKREKQAVRTINSGAFFIDKGDIKTDDCLIEHKMTEGKSIQVNLEVVKKIYLEATMTGKIPILWYEIGDYIFVGKIQRRSK